MRKIIDCRASSLEERRKFYEKEFDIDKVKKWFKNNGLRVPQLCAVDAGTETGIIKDKKLKGKMLFFLFGELKRKIKKYLPEDIYYDRNFYDNPRKVLDRLKFGRWKRQELVFDIDSDNVGCDCGKREVCDSCIIKAFNWAKKLKIELEKEFDKIMIVYSGRGFHVHIFDERAFNLSLKERNL